MKALLIALSLITGIVLGYSIEKEDRSPSTVRAFVRQSPCPVAGPGSCAAKGYEVEHPTALVCGGRDSAADNMVWLNKATHRIKTRADNERCTGTAYGFIMRFIRDVQVWK